MSMPDRSKALTTLLQRARRRAEAAADCGPCPDGCACHSDPVLREFVRSFLMWESTRTKADNALRRIDQAVVDINEFRVAMPDEMAQIIGPNYPRVEERCERLRAALNDIYKREHKVGLAHLADKSKRAAREYLENLAHTPPYVAARVFLVALGGHAFPVDERLHARLAGAGVIDPVLTPAEAGAFLERSIRAGEAAEAYCLIQAWADDMDKPAARPAPRRAARPASSGAKKSPVPRRKSRGD